MMITGTLDLRKCSPIITEVKYDQLIIPVCISKFDSDIDVIENRCGSSFVSRMKHEAARRARIANKSARKLRCVDSHGERGAYRKPLGVSIKSMPLGATLTLQVRRYDD